jgi:DNA-binding response OmpR family regulator
MGIESQSEGAATNRLLIVDDEPDITRIIEITARKLGFEVMSIHDSNRFEQGLEQLRPTIIFLDITMPDRDGLELIGHLAARNYAGQIVVMSGKDERYIQMSSTIGRTRGLSIAGTLTKPFRKDALQDLLIRLSLPPD